MKISIKVKRFSNPNKIIAQSDYDCQLHPCTLRELIEFFVAAEVEKYNSHSENSIAWLYENEEEIQQQSALGKVGFGYRYNDKKADVNKATGIAVQAIQDGLVRIFINDTEFTDLNQAIELHENDEIVFFRFTFISGRMF